MKELNQNVLQNGLLSLQQKGTKEHLENPEGQVEVESTLIGSCF